MNTLKIIRYAMIAFIIVSVSFFSCNQKNDKNITQGTPLHSLAKIAGYNFTLMVNQFNLDKNYTLSVSTSDDSAAFQNLVNYVRTTTNDNSINPVSTRSAL